MLMLRTRDNFKIHSDEKVYTNFGDGVLFWSHSTGY